MISANLEMARAEQMFRLVMFTSAVEDEGKSTVASNVAVALAQAGKQVLLVDINIHRPVLAQRFALSSQPGLTDFILKPNKDWQIERMSQSTDIPGLQILPAGTQKMNSAEFLQALATSQFFSRLQLTSYDYILLDAPPLLAVAETQMMAGSLDALVLVVNAARTARETLRKARQMLQKLPKSRVLGIVVNQATWRAEEVNKPYALSQPVVQDELEVIIKHSTIELPAAHQLMLQPPGTHESNASRAFPMAPSIEAGPTHMYPLLLPQPRHPSSTQTRSNSDNLPFTPRPGFLGLPTTGETDTVRLAVPEKIIRPQLSLHGLSINPNGLLSRPHITDELPDDINMDQDKLKTRVNQDQQNR
jgi:capsular exopolysaccharide synthesis family protein